MKYQHRLVALFLMLLLPAIYNSANAQGSFWSNGTSRLYRYGGRLLNNTLSHPLNTIKKGRWALEGRHHTWWACVYADGFRVHNNFRSYRSIEETSSYFQGTCDGGDCDAVTDDGQHVCYPQMANQMVQIHGYITDIYPEGPAD